MQTITIEVSDTKTLKLIEDLESLNLIKIIKDKLPSTGKKLSDILSGSISPEEADAMNLELSKMRNEWERGI
jgi:hypothetical protein